MEGLPSGVTAPHHATQRLSVCLARLAGRRSAVPLPLCGPAVSRCYALFSALPNLVSPFSELSAFPRLQPTARCPHSCLLFPLFPSVVCKTPENLARGAIPPFCFCAAIRPLLSSFLPSYPAAARPSHT